MLNKISNFAKRFKEYRIDKDLTLAEMEEMTGVPAQTLSRYELGQRVPKYDIAISIAENLGLNPLWLQGYDVDINHDYSMPSNIIPLHTHKVPFLGDIACGKPIWADGQRGEYIDIDEDVNADFALRAKGDSMIGARINDGDIVFVRQQPQVENGEIAVVIIDNEATLKRFYVYEDFVSLNAENPSYKPIILREGDAEDIRVLGKAVAFQSIVK